jgi:hypothetical protein
VWDNFSLFFVRFILRQRNYQYVMNPAHNRDRGPVSIMSLRLHWEK